MANVWMVRAGERGYLARDFAKGFVAIGYQELGDMTAITDQEAIRTKYIASYPDAKPGQVGNQVAMFYKFRSVVAVGDTVLTYDAESREYLIGRVASDYYYKPGEVREYPHVRKVKWEGTVSRDVLSVLARNSLGGMLTLFNVNTEVWSDVQKALSGNTAVQAEESKEEEKEEIQQIREDVKGKARDLITDKILRLDSREMEYLVAAILRAMGYKTRVTPIGPDRGVDVLASPDGLGLQEPSIRAEVKHRQGTQIGPQDIRSFLGGLRERNRGLYGVHTPFVWTGQDGAVDRGVGAA